MDDPALNQFDAKIRDQAGVARALARGVKAALERHRKLGEHVAVWRDGKAIVISADEAMALDDKAKL